MNLLEQKEKIISALKNHTLSSVYNNEKNKLPIVISNKDIGYNYNESHISVVKQFHYNDRWFSYKYSIDEPQYTYGIIKVSNMPFITFKNKNNKKSFISTMLNLIYQRYCESFMVFINGKFVNWNYINIVFDCGDTYILLYGEDYNWYNLKSASIDIVVLPFKVDYIGEESNQYFDMMYDIYKSYLQDSISSNENNKTTITVPGIDEIYEYKGMIYNIGAWMYTQLKYNHLGILPQDKINKLKNIDVYKYTYDVSGNIIRSFYTKFNALDKDSYNRTLYENICTVNNFNINCITFDINGLHNNSSENIIKIIDDNYKIIPINKTDITDNYISFINNINNQLFRENLLVFKNGIFKSDSEIDIKYNNIYNEDNEYNKYSYYAIYYDPIEKISNHLTNHFSNEFINSHSLNYFKSSNNNEKEYIESSIEPLNFSYSDELIYDENKADAYDKIINYDITLFNSLYETNIISKCFTGIEANEVIINNFSKYNKKGLVISRNKYENHESYVLVFEDGELLAEYSNMIVSSNYFFIPIDRLFANDSEIELIYFNKINNNELEFTLTIDMLESVNTTINDNNETIPDYSKLNIDFSSVINQDEVKIFANYPEEIMKYKNVIDINKVDDNELAVNVSTIDTNGDLNVISLLNKKLTVVSSRKFIYQRLYVDQKAYRIKIDNRFKFCDNQRQYILFINGRRMNDESFLITIPKYTRPFWDMYLYITKFVTPEDRIELFYIPEELIDININNDSILDENGYIMSDKKSLDVPYDPRLYLLFINGKKISNNNILTIDSSTFRILKDYQSTNKLMINPIYINTITDIKNYMSGNFLNDYDSLIKYIKLEFDETELDKIFNIFISMSNTDTNKIKQNVGKIAILNEIIRDFWIASGYNYNTEIFTYDYDTLLFDLNVYNDINPHYILPALDATLMINIIKNELYLRSFNIYFNNTISDGFFELGTFLDNLQLQWEYIDPQNSFINKFDLVKQYIKINNTIYDLDIEDRLWDCPITIYDDIMIYFYANTVSKDVYKKIDIKFVNGIFYGNIDENIFNKTIISDTSYIQNDNQIKISNILNMNDMNKVLQDSPELVLDNYSFGNNNYFVFACPERLVINNTDNVIINSNNINDYLTIDFVMPDPVSNDIKENCRDSKATPIYTSGKWDDITKHNLFEPLNIMKMIYLGSYNYINNNGYTEKYCLWRSNGYFTRLFDLYKFNKVVIRYKENSKTINFANS